MDLKSKAIQPDNAEKCYKCPNCGNMVTVSANGRTCDVCGAKLDNATMTIGASNEDY